MPDETPLPQFGREPLARLLSRDRLNAGPARAEELARFINRNLDLSGGDFTPDDHWVPATVEPWDSGARAGNQYRVKFARSDPAAPNAGPAAVVLDDTPGLAADIHATNLAEDPAGTPALPEGQHLPVQVFFLYGRGSASVWPVFWMLPGVAFFDARVTANHQDGSNRRWFYDFVEVRKNGRGYGAWADKTGGRTGTYDADPDYSTAAFNEAEDQNGASGLYGNGVNSANLAGTFDVQPIPTGTRVTVKEVPWDDGAGNTGTEYWIVGMPSGIDGAC